MRTIRTKKLPATNSEGERIRVIDSAGALMTMQFPYDKESTLSAHRWAASQAVNGHEELLVVKETQNTGYIFQVEEAEDDYYDH